LPGSIAGEVAKGVTLALKEKAARAGLISSIVADKVVGLVALLVVFDAACVAIYMTSGSTPSEVRHLAMLALVLTAVGAMATAGVLFVGSRQVAKRRPAEAGPLRRATRSLLDPMQDYIGQPRLLARAFALSLAVHAALIIGTYLSFRALGIGAGLVFAAIVYAVLQIVLMLPISISGIGLRDATLAVLFILYGLPAESGVALSWLTLLATVPNLLIGGGIQLWELYRTR